eukprot:TRINITY_DN11404_c0_g1_i1.p1 TRINITY_DN11404_c0_g1~~TRINITY_DN11404_c0_g1_i1.p1  ORF type:complete len:452 (+),score=116.10 TRINITY_DN11404_c0_g1_i1:80-1357(+)
MDRDENVVDDEDEDQVMEEEEEGGGREEEENEDQEMMQAEQAGDQQEEAAQQGREGQQLTEWQRTMAEELKMVEDVKVRTPHQIIYDEIEKETRRIMKLVREDPMNSAADLAFEADIPKFADLCAEFEPLRVQFRSALKAIAAPQNPIRLLNSLTEEIIQNRIQEVTRAKGNVKVEVPEVVIRIGIYDARTKMQSQEFLALGSQTLAELKDAIICLTDKVYGCKYSRSSYFFIEDVFYDDMRAPAPRPPAENEDGKTMMSENAAESTDGGETVEDDVMPFRYSDGIIEWVKQKKRFAQPGLSRFRQSNMETTVIGDLSVRLNSMYHYVHHGQCTHVVVFKEVRMFDAHSDCLNRLVYPLLIYQPRHKVRKCGVCDIYAAKHVVYGDRLAPETPFFYCTTCYHQLHYDANGNLLYQDFQVFPYYHD